MTRDDDGPSLQQYVETRFNLLIEQIRAKTAAQDAVLGAHVEAAKAAALAAKDAIEAAQAAADMRYQQRFEAQERSITQAFKSHQDAMLAALQGAKEAVNAALAAADRAVAKAESASDKRFDGVNEFRSALSDQQRTLIPRAEVDVLVKALGDRFVALEKVVDAQVNIDRGVKGGWGYAVGGLGFLLALLSLLAWVLKIGGDAAPKAGL